MASFIMIKRKKNPNPCGLDHQQPKHTWWQVSCQTKLVIYVTMELFLVFMQHDLLACHFVYIRGYFTPLRLQIFHRYHLLTMLSFLCHASGHKMKIFNRFRFENLFALRFFVRMQFWFKLRSFVIRLVWPVSELKKIWNN